MIKKERVCEERTYTLRTFDPDYVVREEKPGLLDAFVISRHVAKENCLITQS